MSYETTLTGAPTTEVGRTPIQREALNDYLAGFRGWCSVHEDPQGSIVIETDEGQRTITPSGTIIYDDPQPPEDVWTQV